MSVNTPLHVSLTGERATYRYSFGSLIPPPPKVGLPMFVFLLLFSHSVIHAFVCVYVDGLLRVGRRHGYAILLCISLCISLTTTCVVSTPAPAAVELSPLP